MRHRTLMYMAILALVAAFVSVATPARAQTYTGRIDITVEDSTGGRLPGVTVELTGQMVHSAVSDARGEVHFLNLNVGTYQVKASLTGFNDWKNTNVPVAGGVAVPLQHQDERGRREGGGHGDRRSRRSSTTRSRRRRSTSASTNCRIFPARATRGSSCSRCPASSWTA